MDESAREICGTWCRIEGETGDDATIEIAQIDPPDTTSAARFSVKGFAKYDLPGDPDLIASVGSFDDEIEMIEPAVLVHCESCYFDDQWTTTIMRLRDHRLHVEEENAHRAYGFNVTFAGVYRKFPGGAGPSTGSG